MVGFRCLLNTIRKIEPVEIPMPSLKPDKRVKTMIQDTEPDRMSP